ncbi:hypothetical protein F383_16793 [Gossypium arboreum]|uniref:Uncharacterized protein n=1 Tax=Gossypium arboreum TaxID=29729 RepID=A0A0B0MKK5_GOSAR|nr:hypothetical protein F383_16793 [Gossypium arboreum]
MAHGLAHGHVWPFRRAHGLDTRTCGWPCDPSQYTLSFSKGRHTGMSSAV